MLQCIVNGMSLYIDDRCKDFFTSGSKGLTVHFTFDDEWAGLQKRAVFQNGKGVTSVPISNDVCIVPSNVLEEPGKTLSMGVTGNNAIYTKVMLTEMQNILVYFGTPSNEKHFRVAAISIPIWPFSESGVKQGACTDGEYIYMVGGTYSNGAFVNPYIFKYKIADGIYTKRQFVGTPAFGHANDMTYNPNNNRLYVATMLNTYPLLMFDASDLSYIGSIEQVISGSGNSYKPYQICYDRYNDCFYSTYNGNIQVYDNEWNYLYSINTPVRSSGTAQGCETDGQYIYRVFWNPNEIEVYTIEGEFVTLIADPIGTEPETLMYDWTGNFYCNKNTTGSVFYRMILEES